MYCYKATLASGLLRISGILIKLPNGPELSDPEFGCFIETNLLSVTAFLELLALLFQLCNGPDLGDPEF